MGAIAQKKYDHMYGRTKTGTSGIRSSIASILGKNGGIPIQPAITFASRYMEC